jgi:hypothetical protein
MPKIFLEKLFFQDTFLSYFFLFQFAIKDSNRNDPEFVNVANYKYSVLERIGEVELAPEASPVTAIDGDRCWYGNGRVQFRSSDNGLFRGKGIISD